MPRLRSNEFHQRHFRTASADLLREELEVFDDFLGSPALEGESMDVSMLEGFFATLALSPRVTMPGEWMPWVWDCEHGNVEPEFEGIARCNRMARLLEREVA